MAIQSDELQSEIEKMRQRVNDASEYLNLNKLRAQLEQLEEASGQPGFWDDAQRAQEHMKELTRIKSLVTPWDKIKAELNDAAELTEMALGDSSMQAELLGQANTLQTQLEQLETRALLKDPEDVNDAYLHIHAGAGGTESCDWASMILRMYSRWCEQNGYTLQEIEMTEGEEAGIRSVTLLVKGEYAYGQLKAESGIHRLVRISPFDSAKRRHTSFVSVYASPVVDETVEIEIRDEDLKIDTYRSSGAGGQHVNKTSSAVRITHIPTKIVVQCQNERSQHQNKAQAMNMLRSRLYQKVMDERQVEQDAKNSQKRSIAWGSQIRSYVFQPYQMVKDHRTGYQTGNITAVMDGDLDRFIEMYLRWEAGMIGGAEGGDEDI